MNTRMPAMGTRLAVLGLLLFIRSGVTAPDPLQITRQNNRDITVHSVRELLPSGETVNWSDASKRLLVSKRAANQYYNVYSVTAEGFRLKCLTLGRDRGTAGLHHGNAAWHPGGEYYVFTSQIRGSDTYQMSIPGTGLNCNLWLGDRGGNRHWRLTSLTVSRTSPRGVVSPYFNPDGTRLVWAGNTGFFPTTSVWGERALFVAEFDFEGGKPRLREQRKLQPGENQDFYESHGFTPDGNHIVFSANLLLGQPVYGMDLFTYDLRNSTVAALTKSPEVWDEFASYSADGRKIVWMSSGGQKIRYIRGGAQWKRFLKSELWIMDADGSDPVQLTFFNTPEHLHNAFVSGRRCFVGDSAWSPAGNQIAICLHRETRNFNVESSVLLLDLGIGPVPEVVPTDEEREPATTPEAPSTGPPLTPKIPTRW